MLKNKAASPEDVQALLDTIAKIDSIDLERLSVEMEKRKTKKELAAEAMERMDFKLKPKIKHSPSCDGKCGGTNKCRKKQHWRVKKRYYRDYHQTVRKPQNAKRRSAKLREEGWYGILRELWERRGLEVEVTQADWEEAVGTLDDCYPMVTRYSSAVGIRLDNVLVRDRDTLQVVFDGKEWLLKAAGYCL